MVFEGHQANNGAIRKCYSTIPLMPKMANRMRFVAFEEQSRNWSQWAERRERGRCVRRQKVKAAEVEAVFLMY